MAQQEPAIFPSAPDRSSKSDLMPITLPPRRTLLSLPNEIIATVIISLHSNDLVMTALSCHYLHNLILQLHSAKTLHEIVKRPYRYGSNHGIFDTLFLAADMNEIRDESTVDWIQLIGQVKRMAGAGWKYCCTFEVIVHGKRYAGHGCHIVPVGSKKHCRCSCFVCAGTICSIRHCDLTIDEKLQLWSDRRELEVELIEATGRMQCH